jgi:hypothetical protein
MRIYSAREKVNLATEAKQQSTKAKDHMGYY